MYGTFPLVFEPVIAPFVADRVVVDLGSGYGERARILERLGARVVKIDKDEDIPGVIHGYFESMIEEIEKMQPDVIHLAWPTANLGRRATDVFDLAPVLIYVGKNTEGSVCGTPAMFRYLAHRVVLAYEPTRANVLIVYGRTQREPRRMLHYEEAAGIERATVWSYSDTREMLHV